MSRDDVVGRTNHSYPRRYRKPLDSFMRCLHDVIMYEYTVHEVLMKKASLISVRVPAELAARLDNLSKATDRSKSCLATLAIEEFVAVQEWQVEAIKEGMADADEGRVGRGA